MQRMKEENFENDMEAQELNENMDKDIQTSSEDDASPEGPEVEADHTNENETQWRETTNKKREEIKHEQRFCIKLQDSSNKKTLKL